MYRTVIFYLISFFFLYSCHSQNDNEYFYQLDKEYTALNNDREKIYGLYIKENEKYKKTQDLKYLISSKYIEMFLYPDNRSKKISLIYELLRINNDEYDYITTACNFNLALEFEEASPKLCLQFLNAAIKIEEKSDKKTFLPHLYHMKGRWYFNHNNYYQAKLYFGKGLNSLCRKDTLYIASMYNNFALCDQRMGRIDSSIKLSLYGLKILQNKKSLTEGELYFINLMKGNLGSFYFIKKDYTNAIKYYNEQIEFQMAKANRNPYIIIRNSAELLQVYKYMDMPLSSKKLIERVVATLPKLESTKDGITACTLLQNYYAENNDFENLKLYSKKLEMYNNLFYKETVRDLDAVSDILNGYIIKNINQEYDYKIADQRKKTALMIILAVVVIIFFIRAIIRIRKRNKEERRLLESQNTLLENDKEDLEKDIELQKGKIKNLHLNLNLKIETEKAFLENLKKIKKSKNINGEETVKDLLFKINNLLQIDQKNHDFIGESSEETKQFMQKISERFPFLTEHELKLCVYFRLNLSSKEVSLLENITPGSVRVYKTKIKYKIGLVKETDLNVFLNSIK
ncbi:helix-turn-helix transcriptional regulator [Chryseobacterium sp. SIMBA_038]|uniref:helix-turn-helix transcriptional regulator n=1 Tax=Chryseobacterium sp. SIMBA_038 TaxID=3085780 RepID=UPI00397C1FA1